MPTNVTPQPKRRTSFLPALLAATALLLSIVPAVAQDANQQTNDQTTTDQQNGALQTASFQLFPVEGSGVSAQLQVTSTVDGGVKLIMSASGIDTGSTYGAAIYHGDCGPDRALALELTPVGSAPNDPFASTTETSKLSFDDLTTGNYFVYLFDGNGIDRPETFGLDTPALACGEVGKGANR